MTKTRDDIIEDLERSTYNIRTMQEKDFDAVMNIDRKRTENSRKQYLSQKIKESLLDSGIVVSMVAEEKNRIVGFMIADIFYGEFGQMETSASINTVGVDPDFEGRGVATALMDQFMGNMKVLLISKIETIVDWDENFDLLTFFKKRGFAPGKRVALSYTFDTEV